MVRCTALVLLPWLLAGCGGQTADEAPPPRDPQVAQALNDPLMTDPDLASRNEGAAALTVESDSSLPALPATPEAIAAARAEAAVLVGGANLLKAPPAAAGTVAALADETEAAHITSLTGVERCAARLRSSAIWAARLPAAMPIYPRGATVSAAGSDAQGCVVRAAEFTTPVPLDDVLAFYWTRAKMGHLAPVHRIDGTSHVLTGKDDRLRFDVRLRKAGSVTVVRLATSGT